MCVTYKRAVSLNFKPAEERNGGKREKEEERDRETGCKETLEKEKTETRPLLYFKIIFMLSI